MLPRQLLVDHGVEHDARLLLDVLEHLRQLLLGADQRIDVLDRARILVLRRGRAAGREQRLAGGVGDQVQVEEALGFVHRVRLRLWACVDKPGPVTAGRLGGDCIRWPVVHNSLPAASSISAPGDNSGDKCDICPARHPQRRVLQLRQAIGKVMRISGLSPDLSLIAGELAPAMTWLDLAGRWGQATTIRFQQTLRIRKL